MLCGCVFPYKPMLLLLKPFSVLINLCSLNGCLKDPFIVTRSFTIVDVANTI